jgi:hypothetical protein
MPKKKDESEITDLTSKQEEKLDIIGLDVGTMNLVCARQDDNDSAISVKSIRNMYLPIEKDSSNVSDLTQLSYVETEDMIYIISEDAYRMANIFGNPVKRPMKDGLISSSDVDSLDVLALVMEHLVGRTKNGICYYSIPAASIDSNNDILYHTNVFKRIFNELGYKAVPVNEAMAIIYNECSDSNFTGLSFSFGSGMTNCAMSFKGNLVLEFSVGRGGDWIDDNVARQFGTVPNRITSIKENNTDISDYKQGNKKERRIREAICYYYQNLITYALDTIKDKLDNELQDVQLPESVPVVVSGGTSMAKGFMDMFKGIIGDYDEFPFEIQDIVHAQDPLACVAEGLLIKGISDYGD